MIMSENGEYNPLSSAKVLPMRDQDDLYYQAMLARDYRFDGKFFIGVKTTGVYCRPICPAKPKRRNVEFFPHAVAAERAGYRPCLRCRPESAPDSPTWIGTTVVVQRALKQIANNELLHTDEDTFASRLGVTARHLRRLFVQEIGQTPKRISDNNRLDFARKLVVETHLPMTAAAMTAGFSSLRRFNDAFKVRFRRSPSQLRRKQSSADPGAGVELTLSYRPPFGWDNLLSFYQSHTLPGLQEVVGNRVQRLFRMGSTTGFLEIQPVPDLPQLRLRVIAGNPTILFDVVRCVRRMFDLDSDPLLIANHFSSFPSLDRLYRVCPGLRVPRGWDPFETAVCTILGQLVSVSHASALVGQLISAYGDEIVHPLTSKPARVFPTAETLARSDLAHVKTTTARKQTIREFSRRVLSGVISLNDAQDPAAFRQALLNIKGLGPWSAEYISLRALGDTDAFPAKDLILARALEHHPDLDLDLVKPWRAYAAVYFWKEFSRSLSKKRSIPHAARL